MVKIRKLTIITCIVMSLTSAKVVGEEPSPAEFSNFLNKIHNLAGIGGPIKASDNSLIIGLTTAKTRCFEVKPTRGKITWEKLPMLAKRDAYGYVKIWSCKAIIYWGFISSIERMPCSMTLNDKSRWNGACFEIVGLWQNTLKCRTGALCTKIGRRNPINHYKVYLTTPHDSETAKMFEKVLLDLAKLNGANIVNED